jgi:hypothetical protein
VKRIEASIDIAADAVWRIVGDPGALSDWAPALENSRLEGDIRHTEFAGGVGGGTERIVDLDDAQRRYTYRHIEGPIPVDEYESTIQVLPQGAGAVVHWTAEFTAASDAVEAELATTIAGLYNECLESLRLQLEPAAAG